MRYFREQNRALLINAFYLMSILSGIMILGCSAPDNSAQPILKNEKQVIEAILQENWTQVIALLDSVEEDSLPVARLIKGHACLAVNRNNESLCLFLSVLSEDSLKAAANLKQWQEWSRKFAEKNSQNAIAFYFKGDGLARLQQWDAAIEAFNQALAIKPNHHLIFHSRGVAYAAKGEWDSALIDFDEATTADTSFADAYASLGAMWIQRRTGEKGALQAFNRALKLSPEFALALNGRGCANFALGHWEKALKDLSFAAEKATCFNMPMANLVAFTKMKDEFIALEQNKLASIKPGMSIDAITKFSKNLDPISAQKAFDQVEEKRRHSQFWANTFGMLSGSFGSGSREDVTKLEVIGNSNVPGVNVKGFGEVGTTQTKSWDLGSHFQSWAEQSQRHANDWTNLQNQLRLDHKIDKISPGGVTTEDLQYAFIDKGNWFDTGYGLAYHVEPVKMSGTK